MITLKSLISLSESITDCHHSTPEFTDKGKMVIRSHNVKNGRLVLDRVSYTTDEDFELRTSRAIPRSGDLIITREAPMGEVCIVPDDLECCLGQRLVLIRPDASKVYSKYLLYMIMSGFVQNQIESHNSSGSTVSNLRIPVLKELDIPYIELEDQQKVAAVLSVLDDKIELNRKINAELEQMARTLYDYWFVQFDFPDANGKPYKSSGGQMAYNDQLKREIPAGWKAVQLEDILNKRTENAEPNSNLRCIDLSVMPSGSLSIDNFSAGDAFNSNMKKMHKNDILFGSIRPYLKKAGLAPFDGLRAGTVHAFYPRKPEHLELCLITMTSERYFDYAINRSGGSTRMPSISSDDLLDYSVPFSEDVYFKYHKVLTSFTDAISNNIQQSQKLAELRDWLLPMLMNGQVKVL